MAKIRDLIYNTSDIIVTLIIIAAAALIIYSRIDTIMSYTDGTQLTTDGTIVSSSIINDSDAGSAGTDGSATGDGSAQADDSQSAGADQSGQNAEPVTYSFTVEPGENVDSIAQKLLDSGIITDKQAFLDAVTAADASTRIKAGTFSISTDMTPQQIVYEMTK